MNLHHVRMDQFGDGCSFRAKTSDEIFVSRKLARQHFNGDIAVQRRLISLVNISHPAAADAAFDAKRAELSAGGERITTSNLGCTIGRSIRLAGGAAVCSGRLGK